MDAMPDCPICEKPADPRYQPFCSKRCADVDLGRWLSDRYVVPGVEEDEPKPDAEEEQ